MSITSVLYIFMLSLITTIQWEDKATLKFVADEALLGDICIVPSTYQNGKCIKIDDCPYAKDLLRQNISPGFCGFIGIQPMVCCPALEQEVDICTTHKEARCSNEISPQKQKSIRDKNTPEILRCFDYQKIKSLKSGLAQNKCNEYAKRDKFFIIQGEKVLPHEFPHMAAIGYGDESNITWTCGGTLISRHFVLSAAHCVDSLNLGPAKWIRLGDVDLQNPKSRNIAITKAYVLCDYMTSSHYHDIALFKMKNKVIFSDFVRPACLHLQEDLPANSVEVAGWGQVDAAETRSTLLMKTTLRVLDHATCDRRYKVRSHRFNMGIISETQFCAGDSEGKDTCPGDSGGPLHYRVGRQFIVAGVTSFGRTCGGQDTAGVYTRVSAYLPWIERIVWEHDE